MEQNHISVSMSSPHRPRHENVPSHACRIAEIFTEIVHVSESGERSVRIYSGSLSLFMDATYSTQLRRIAVSTEGLSSRFVV